MMAESTSSSEDEESDDEECADGAPATKRRRLRVPPSVIGLFDDAAPCDNPTLHQGRTRRVAHVEGNFATIVYLPIDATGLWRHRAEAAAAMLRKLTGKDADVHTNDMGPKDGNSKAGSLGLHVSLGPMLTLRQQFIRPFVEQMKKAVVGINVGTVFFDDEVEVFASPGGGRYFAGVVVSEASASWLRAIAGKALSAAEAFSLAPKTIPVDDMRLHCSLAWTIADLQQGLAAVGAERHESSWGMSWRIRSPRFVDGATHLQTPLTAPANVVQVKVGERIYLIRMAYDGSDQDEGAE